MAIDVKLDPKLPWGSSTAHVSIETEDGVWDFKYRDHAASAQEREGRHSWTVNSPDGKQQERDVGGSDRATFEEVVREFLPAVQAEEVIANLPSE